ncbi:hypothetical protein SAMD00019534_050780 [Acytostelium subglobosum LB1]|uniref:hypothetical protein n=1 Tax=Acytostelium subglobosum LB1 TaxID=1410327 RepID=UPI000644E78D|nr:hypothetical protein SAMD00019534_050780 [Acytostelium subglobosum LB1]GAM21903.1 hypothetical protein SAMD00019534_050780 [Acytostelium subglobosum LB1]|eukprot:XP_012755003.1 hypothetical protein SAMD00019534_050780 [Acytostelium subglobosum LB1]
MAREAKTNAKSTAKPKAKPKSKSKSNEDNSSDGDNQTFNNAIKSVIDRIMVHYNKEQPIERICKFLSHFINSISLRNNNNNRHVEEEEDDDVEREAPTSETLDIHERFIVSILEYLVARSYSREKAVRYRSTMLLSNTLDALREDYEFDMDLFEQMTKSIMQKSMDRISSIRRQAIICLARLQDGSDPEDPVTNRIIDMMHHDTSFEVRQTAVSHLMITKTAVEHLLMRTLDVSPQVRKEAYSVISTKIDVKMIGIAKRTGLLKNGLQDRDKSVKEICSTMLSDYWLKSVNDDLFKLLAYFEVDMFEKETEMALMSLFQRGLCLGQLARIQIDPMALTKEQAIYLNVLCQFLHKEKRTDDHIESTIIPSMMHYSDMLLHYLTKDSMDDVDVNEHDDDDQEEDEDDTFFIGSQVISIGMYMDKSDEAGRVQVSTLIPQLALSSTLTDGYLPPLMDLLLSVQSSEYIVSVAGILRELFAALNDEEHQKMYDLYSVQQDGLRQLMSKRKDLQAQSVSAAKNKTDMARITGEIKTVDDTIKVLESDFASVKEEIEAIEATKTLIDVKLLKITIHLLQHIDVRVSPRLLERISMVVARIGSKKQPTCLQPLVIKLHALYLLVAPASLGQHLPTILGHLTWGQHIDHDDEADEAEVDVETVTDLYMNSLESIVDLLVWYGDQLEQHQTEHTVVGLAERIYESLDCPGLPATIQHKTLEGLAKICYSLPTNAETTERILIRLTTTFLAADTEAIAQTQTKQVLSTFFNMFAANRSNDALTLLLTKTLMPVLRALMDQDSATADTSLATAIRFYLWTIGIACPQPGGAGQIERNKWRCSLLRSIGLEAMSNTAKAGKLCKLLSVIKLDGPTPAPVELHNELMALVCLSDKMSTAIKTKIIYAQIRKFSDYLTGLLPNGRQQVASDELQEQVSEEIDRHCQEFQTMYKVSKRQSTSRRSAAKGRGSRSRHISSDEEESWEEEDVTEESEEEEEYDDDEEEEEEEEEEEVEVEKVITKQMSKMAINNRPKRGNRVVVEVSDDDEEESEEEVVKVAPRRTLKQLVQSENEEEDDEEDDDQESSEEEKVILPKRSLKQLVESDEDEEEEEDDEDDQEEESSEEEKVITRRSLKQLVESESEEEEDDEEDEESSEEEKVITKKSLKQLVESESEEDDEEEEDDDQEESSEEKVITKRSLKQLVESNEDEAEDDQEEEEDEEEDASSEEDDVISRGLSKLAVKDAESESEEEEEEEEDSDEESEYEEEEESEVVESDDESESGSEEEIQVINKSVRRVVPTTVTRKTTTATAKALPPTKSAPATTTSAKGKENGHPNVKQQQQSIKPAVSLSLSKQAATTTNKTGKNKA